MSRHSEFVHASNIPEDSCDFDYDEIDRNVFGEHSLPPKPSAATRVKASLMDEVSHLRKLAIKIITSHDPVQTSTTFLNTLCPNVY